MPRGPRAAAQPRPELDEQQIRQAEYMLRDTFTFWQETDTWPCYEEPHREMFGILDESGPDMSHERSKPTSTMFLGPRFSYKTYGAAKSIARRVIKYPDISIGIFRSTRDEARKLMRLVKNILRSQPVVQYFGDPYFGAQAWNEDEVVVPWRTVNRADPTLFTMGTSGTSTGNHPDYIYGDDLVTEVNADSPKEQENLWSYIEAFQPQLPSWGGLLLTGTRWSSIDCYGRVIALNEAAQRAGKDVEQLPWKVIIRQADEELADGSRKLYFPAYLTEERIADLKLMVEARRFNAWMYNRMVDPADKPFKPEHIHLFNGPYRFDYPYKRTIQLLDQQFAGEKVRLYVAMIVDPALTDEVGSCGYGLTVIGWDRKRRWFVLESRERVLLPSRAESIITEMLLRYRPNRMLIESAGGDAGLIAAIGAFIEREHLDCIIQPFSALQHEKFGKRSKDQRIREMERIVSADDVYFRVADDPKRSELFGGYCYDLLKQIDHWPSLTRNDAIDSWAMGRYVLPYVPTDEGEYEDDLSTANPAEWDISWKDSAGISHGLPAEKAAALALGPPPGADAARWLESLEYGTPRPGYRPGARTAEYLRSRRRTG